VKSLRAHDRQSLNFPVRVRWQYPPPRDSNDLSPSFIGDDATVWSLSIYPPKRRPLSLAFPILFSRRGRRRPPEPCGKRPDLTPPVHKDSPPPLPLVITNFLKARRKLLSPSAPSLPDRPILKYVSPAPIIPLRPSESLNFLCRAGHPSLQYFKISILYRWQLLRNLSRFRHPGHGPMSGPSTAGRFDHLSVIPPGNAVSNNYFPAAEDSRPPFFPTFAPRPGNGRSLTDLRHFRSPPDRKDHQPTLSLFPPIKRPSSARTLSPL